MCGGCAQENILQLLRADCGQVERLVGDAVAQLSAALAASAVTPLDRCQLMEQMNDNHAAQLLPRARAADAGLAALSQRCLDCKARSPRSVHAQPKTSRQAPKIPTHMTGVAWSCLAFLHEAVRC